MVTEFSPGDEIELRLEAYPDYWGGWDDADHYERYVFRVTPEANTAAQLLRAGEVSMVQRMSRSCGPPSRGRTASRPRAPRRGGRCCSACSTRRTARSPTRRFVTR